MRDLTLHHDDKSAAAEKLSPEELQLDPLRALQLDPERCYRALASRDARFDGRFFTAVTSTGVYCRPICPARTPKRANVRFYACAAAAEAAGFRACLRCRPEASPGTPAWLGTSSTVSRALRYIAEGALDEESVDALAARLGIGERHLRRLFVRHLGAAPLAVAQTQRVHFAKRLITETDLPMTRIAMDAGFASVRRFNAAMHAAYGRSPTVLRRARARARVDESGGDLTLRLAFRPPFPWDAVQDFLRVRAVPGVEHVGRDVYRRSMRVGDTSGIIELRRPHGDAWVQLRVPIALSHGLAPIVAAARRLLDLGADPREIASQLARDRALGRRVRRQPGLRVPGAWDGFEIAVRAVVGQQVTVKGATTLMGRLVERHGTSLPASARNGVTHLFPTPERLAHARLDRLGMPGARARTISRLARAVADGEIRLDASQGLEPTVAQLTALPGIGPWTAHYIAMRVFGEPDAFPEGDLGLRRALVRGRVVSARELTARAEAWRPWRSYAAMYLWQIP